MALPQEVLFGTGLHVNHLTNLGIVSHLLSTHKKWDPADWLMFRTRTQGVGTPVVGFFLGKILAKKETVTLAFRGGL